MFMMVLSTPIYHKHHNSTEFAISAIFKVCFCPAVSSQDINKAFASSAFFLGLPNSVPLLHNNQNIKHEYEWRNKSKFLLSNLTCMFCEANALGHISRAAVALSSFPVSPLTTTRLSRQAQATAVRWLPSLTASDSGPCDVARSSKRSNKGSEKTSPSGDCSHTISPSQQCSHTISPSQQCSHTISPSQQCSHTISPSQQ